jgi:predicted RNA binding protein YcfA (HicA-like mRNA interferase family)
MPSDVRFAEVKRFAYRNGWVLARINGSHHIFKKPDGMTHSVPVHHGKVKYQYWRDIQREVAKKSQSD